MSEEVKLRWMRNETTIDPIYMVISSKRFILVDASIIIGDLASKVRNPTILLLNH